MYISLVLMHSILTKLWEHSKDVCLALMSLKDKDGNTPLHFACQKGHLEVVNEICKIIQDSAVPAMATRSDTKLHIHYQGTNIIISESLYFDYLTLK